MSFVTRIPAEILSEIFHLLCDEPIALEKLENSTGFDKFPWAAGQVCRHWRAAFLFHPPLWTSLLLRDPRCLTSAAYLAEMKRRTAIYLKRSGQLPLTITISTIDPFGIDAISQMLSSYSNRWRKADIYVPSMESTIDDALGECKGKMPILESLTISMSVFRGMRCHNAFDIAPRLTELDLTLYRGKLETWMFPWAQLTKLSVALSYAWSGSETELRAFLLQLKNVEELQFMVDIPHNSWCPPVHLPCLRFLETSFEYLEVYSWLQAPLLEHLSLVNIPDFGVDPDFRQEEISSLIDCLSYRIRQLTLRNCNIELLRNTMKALANIEELCIKGPVGPTGPPDLIRDIAESGDCTYLLSMRVLQVKCCPGHLEKLVQDISLLVEARIRGSTLGAFSYDVTPLETLVIEDCCEAAFGKSIALDSALEAMPRGPSFPNAVLTKATDGLLSLMLVFDDRVEEHLSVS